MSFLIVTFFLMLSERVCPGHGRTLTRKTLIFVTVAGVMSQLKCLNTLIYKKWWNQRERIPFHITSSHNKLTLRSKNTNWSKVRTGKENFHKREVVFYKIRPQHEVQNVNGPTLCVLGFPIRLQQLDTTLKKNQCFEMYPH